jgi:hypothetical protein
MGVSPSRPLFRSAELDTKHELGLRDIGYMLSMCNIIAWQGPARLEQQHSSVLSRAPAVPVVPVPAMPRIRAQ